MFIARNLISTFAAAAVAASAAVALSPTAAADPAPPAADPVQQLPGLPGLPALIRAEPDHPAGRRQPRAGDTAADGRSAGIHATTRRRPTSRKTLRRR